MYLKTLNESDVKPTWLLKKNNKTLDRVVLDNDRHSSGYVQDMCCSFSRYH